MLFFQNCLLKGVIEGIPAELEILISTECISSLLVLSGNPSDRVQVQESISEIINMAISGKTIMVLTGTLMAVLLAASTDGAVTVYNPAKIPLDVAVDDKRVKVETDIVSVDLTQAEQQINVTTASGGLVSAEIKDGDVLVVLPEPLVGVGNRPAVKMVELPGGESGDFNQSGVDSALPPDFDRYGPDYAQP